MSKMKYEIITTIKESEKGNVYLAVVPGYGLPLIVKQMKNGNEAVLKRLAAMDELHIPRIYRYEKTEEGLLVFEEHIEGELLSEYLRNRKLTDEELLELACQLCEALEVLHGLDPPLIHRDVKPSNVIVNSKGVVKLIDFDSARIYKEELDTDTKFLGTEQYAAPEQYGFTQTDRRSDIYSLGVVLGRFPALSTEKRQKAWKKIVERCTLFDPDNRYQTVAAVKNELKKVVKKGKSGVWRGACVAAVCVLLVIGGIGFTGAGKNTDASLTSPPEESKSQVPPQETMPVGTTVPTPTSVPTATQGPTPTSVPAATSAPTLTPEVSSDYVTDLLKRFHVSMVSDSVYVEPGVHINAARPEHRILETDSPNTKAIKSGIIERGLNVAYYFKERMQGTPYLSYYQYFEDETIVIQGVRLISCETGDSVWLDEETVKIENNILQISGEYMSALEDGFYLLQVEMFDTSVHLPLGWGMFLYVAPNDTYKEEEYFLLNNLFELRREGEKKLHFLLRSGVEDRISSLQIIGEGEVAPSLYEILYDGRAVELSEEFVKQCCEKDYLVFEVETEKGLYQRVTFVIQDN